MPSPLVQDFMTESITFIVTASPAFVAGLDSGAEKGGGDQGDDDKKGNSKAILVKLLPTTIAQVSCLVNGAYMVMRDKRGRKNAARGYK
ncbi:hypothetical protein EC957_006762 [Mortierella hygrophila]|uniref:Uncharacterized protein n=1 Tax=Mortierella hygrophila TaxID=979708 RepID=A0A9P6EZ71_9FUNG|nr:hypothetical protein EC957_006762 [Mortierella hygrophila]